MRGILNAALTLVLAAFLLNGAFSVMRASMVRGNADVYIAPEACPTRVVAGTCVVTGDESEDFVSGDTTITLKDGSTWYIPRRYVQGASWKSENVHYKVEPVIVLLAAGLVLVFGMALVNRLTKRWVPRPQP